MRIASKTFIGKELIVDRTTVDALREDVRAYGIRKMARATATSERSP